MELSEAIRSRRSTTPVTDDAPSEDQLAGYLRLAAHSPDHAGLRPWRLITLRGAARERLGDALAVGFGDEPGTPAAAKTATKTLRAPLLISIVAVPIEHPKVPRWEQLAAVGALVATLQLVLFEAGYTAMWRTGPAVELAPVRQLLAIAEHEQLLGWLYVGGTRAGPSTPEPEPEVAGKISALKA
ncbi:MAG: nitroreductase [Actinomycetota bacterium]|nr:nitroreductase [Actinomycetota bacterium]